MNLRSLKSGSIILLLFILFGFINPIQSNAQTYGKYGTTSKYIKTTRDSITIPGFIGERKTGIITNETASKQLEVFFGKQAAVGLDSNTYFLIPAGKTLLFQTASTRLYRRNASTDSTYSQVYIGNVDLGYNDLPSGFPDTETVSFYLIDNKEYDKMKSEIERNRFLTFK